MSVSNCKVAGFASALSLLDSSAVSRSNGKAITESSSAKRTGFAACFNIKYVITHYHHAGYRHIHSSRGEKNPVWIGFWFRRIVTRNNDAEIGIMDLFEFCQRRDDGSLTVSGNNTQTQRQ